MNKEELIKIADSKLLKVTDRPEIIMREGEGIYLRDTEGNRYLDFIGGWAVNCLGHSPEVISDVLAKQSKTLINSSPSFYNEPMLEYTDLLINNCCFDRVFFTSTGAEANEGAIKLARKYGQVFKGGASEIITTRLGFHGRTLTTMSATGKEQWETLFEPKTKGFLKAEFNDFQSVKELVSDRTCAIMLEPVQGEGGVNVATPEFINSLRDLCDRENILLIFDEIQTGMGRCGTLFCYEQYGVEPDIMTLGKGIGGGFPLSALLAKENLNIFDPGDQGGTYTGQPLAMAVGHAVLKELLDKKIVEHTNNMGNYLMDSLNKLSHDYEITNIRGKGLLIAFDLMETRGSDFVKACLKKKLIINSPKERSIRLMPPLVVSKEEVEAVLDILRGELSKKKTYEDYKTWEEIGFLEKLLELDGKNILELGCGKAQITRLIAEGGKDRYITATEVDEIQHKKNLLIDDLPNVTFVKGGSEDIPVKDSSFDVVFMFKSLHHVPMEYMDDAFKEVKRVLKSSGLVYVSEPVYQGDFNEIIRLFNEEKEVRDAAYGAVKKSVSDLGFEMVEEIFINTPLFFKDFEEFKTRVIDVTHRENVLSPELFERVEGMFSKDMDVDGKRFLQPIRINLLRKK